MKVYEYKDHVEVVIDGGARNHALAIVMTDPFCHFRSGTRPAMEVSAEAPPLVRLL